MAARDPRGRRTAGVEDRRWGHPVGRSRVVRVAAPANDNGPTLLRLAGPVARLACLIAVATALAALLLYR
jgi:hypothetical protein